MAKDFKKLLKELRLRAGYGLREFAELIGEAPSNYAGVESGLRNPWRSRDKLAQVADALTIQPGSQEYDAFFIAASRNGALPPDLEELLEMEEVPMVLRTIKELRLTDRELRELVDDLRKRKNRRRRRKA